MITQTKIESKNISGTKSTKDSNTVLRQLSKLKITDGPKNLSEKLDYYLYQ